MKRMDELTEEGIKRKAYMEGLKMKNSGLDEDVIYARLEKQGIPAELAKQVARDVLIERTKSAEKDEKPFFYLALIKIGIGVLAAVISTFVFPDKVILPIGLILSGVIYAGLSRVKT